MISGSPAAAGAVAEEALHRLSVVIPTSNEEAWLPYLLDVLKSYDEVAEIIVADNDSSDRTVDIACTAGCLVTGGGRPGRARNHGAQLCTNDVILFLDADTVVPRSSLISALAEFARDGALSAVAFRVAPVGDRRIPRVGYATADLYFRVCARLGMHQGLGNAIMVRRKDFDDVGRFDERVDAGEDADLIRRIGRHGRAAYLRSCVAYTSPRRFRVENNVAFGLKVLVWAVMRFIGLRQSVVPYKWTKYPANWGNSDRDDFRIVLSTV
jgi:glycosyltransferase involved in cell wall biosynthesis